MSRYRILPALALAALVGTVAVLQIASRAGRANPGVEFGLGQAQVAESVSPDEEARLEKGSNIALERAADPPDVSADAAIEVAYAQMGKGIDEPKTPPRLTHWLATTPPNVDGAPSLIQLDRRPVWIATFDRVETEGSVPVGSTRSGQYTARVDVFIDASTGSWLWTDKHDLASPDGTPAVP